MHIKSILKIIAFTLAVSAILTAAAAAYFDQHTIRQIADTGSMVAFCICGIGILMSKGARVEDGMMNLHQLSPTSDSPSAMRNAGYSNMLSGVTYGALFIVASLIWLGVVAAAYAILS